MDYFDIQLSEDALREVSALGLAYVGDCVYELLVRSHLLLSGRQTNRSLHAAAVELSRAPAQAAAAAKQAGADEATQKTMFDCVTTDEMLRVLKDNGLLSGTMNALEMRINTALAAQFPNLHLGVIVFTTGNTELFRNETARQWMEKTI